MPTADHLLALAKVAVLLVALLAPAVLFVVGRTLSVGRRGALVSEAA